MAEYKAAKELNSESHVGFWLYAKDFFFLVAYVMVTFMMSSFVASPFKWLYYIYSIICGISLTIPSYFNRKRRTYQSLLIFLHREKRVFHPVTGKEVDTK